ncbi:MAG: YjjG family noncanonical pyrimidine nucleotidase [Lachnospiraceae bacterium]|jgi:2-haloacid dehalogenase
MGKYKAVLWDIDNTLLSFDASETAALARGFRDFGFGELTPQMLEHYKIINRRHWEALERGEMNKEEVLVGRYVEFFTKENLDVSKARAFNDEYQRNLGDTIVFEDYAQELVSGLKGKVLQFVCSNGTRTAQERKLKNSGLDRLFDAVFISETLGYEKPMPGFYDRMFELLEKEGIRVSRGECLMVGDSLTSDMRGGNNAGIDDCWFNPSGAPNTTEVKIQYEIRSLREVPGILGIRL